MPLIPEPFAFGFTGTQRGMTPHQAANFDTYAHWVFHHYLHVEFHHGDCVGADAEAEEIVVLRATVPGRLGYLTIVTHPCHIESKRAHCERLGYQVKRVVHDPLPPLLRNHKIVDAVQAMTGAPGESGEQLRSGTWATVRYTRKEGKPLTLFLPDGKVVRP